MPLIQKVADLLYPLTDFYSSSGAPLPDVQSVAGDDMPEPYRSLLVHTNDMTPTLADYAGEKIHLRLLNKIETGDVLYRQVVLVAGEEEHAVEFGAIKIYLDRFAAEPRRLIREGRIPLGTILGDFSIEHDCAPNGFFSFVADFAVEGAFCLDGPEKLYGRHSLHLNPEGLPLSEVVEILPPLSRHSGSICVSKSIGQVERLGPHG
jgi:chorismate-pyruvate lyase